jgi:hypothetical protein
MDIVNKNNIDREEEPVLVPQASVTVWLVAPPGNPKGRN